MKGLFISGSGTDIGKTFIAQHLLSLLTQSKIVAVRKPVESDCALINGVLIAKDATKLLSLSNVADDIDTVSPYRFESCCSGESASKAENIDLSLKQLLDACQSDEFVVVEGAGGLLSPIANNTLNIDLAKALNLPLIIIIKDELGAINQALMAILAAKQYQLEICCVILNQFEANILDNVAAISHYGKCSVIVYKDTAIDAFNHRMSEILNLG